MTTLICLHGGSGTGRTFLSLSKHLGTSRSIYSPDLPGCGESDAATSPLSVAAYADAVGDFLDSMRFRQVDLLGAGASAAVAAELAIGRPKIVRKVCLLGTAADDTEAATAGSRALRDAAREWNADRRQLIRQPLLSLGKETEAESAVESLARQLSGFFAAT